MKKPIALAIAMGMLLVSLWGCQSTASSQDTFTGTWYLSTMEETGHTTTAEELEELAGLGYYVYLDLDEGEDHVATMNLLGDITVGTWEQQTATTATVTLRNSPEEATLSDGKLTMKYGSSTITFEKGERRDVSADMKD